LAEAATELHCKAMVVGHWTRKFINAGTSNKHTYFFGASIDQMSLFHVVLDLK
jgi:hypothetical protein